MVRISRKKSSRRSKRRSSEEETVESTGAGLSVIRRVIPVLLIVGVLAGLGLWVKTSLYASDLFCLKSVIIHERSGAEFQLEWDMLGKISVFESDLRSLHSSIQRRFPEYKNIILTRRLPDSVFVEVTKRVAVAQVKSGRFFPIDKETIVLPSIRNLPVTDLPIITDETLRLNDQIIGKPVTVPGITTALELLSAMDKSMLSERFAIYEVDVTDPKNVFFYISGGIEIRIGDAPFDKKLSLLSATAEKIPLDPSRIKYIDLRFEDIVIGPR